MPADVYSYFRTLITEVGFFCPASNAICAITGSCSGLASYLPDLDITFKDSGDSFNINITPKLYLFDDTTNFQCSAMITENNDPTASFILGDLFFRSSTIELNFEDKSIMLFDKTLNTENDISSV